VNAATVSLIVCLMKPSALASPRRIDDANDLACSQLMCGGSGGTFGSTTA